MRVAEILDVSFAVDAIKNGNPIVDEDKDVEHYVDNIDNSLFLKDTADVFSAMPEKDLLQDEMQTTFRDAKPRRGSFKHVHNLEDVRGYIELHDFVSIDIGRRGTLVGLAQGTGKRAARQARSIKEAAVASGKVADQVHEETKEATKETNARQTMVLEVRVGFEEAS